MRTSKNSSSNADCREPLRVLRSNQYTIGDPLCRDKRDRPRLLFTTSGNSGPKAILKKPCLTGRSASGAVAECSGCYCSPPENRAPDHQKPEQPYRPSDRQAGGTIACELVTDFPFRLQGASTRELRANAKTFFAGRYPKPAFLYSNLVLTHVHLSVSSIFQP